MALSSPSSSFLSRKAFWLLFALALAVRLLVLGLNLRHEIPYFREPDSNDYLGAAESLHDDLRIVDPEGHPSAWRPPGYPLPLAALFTTGLATPDHLVGVILAQILLASLSVSLASS